MAVPFHTHNFELPVADAADIEAGVATDKVVVPATLGTAATKDTSAFATAAQGAKADAAAPATRQVIAGAGLQGGGALSGNVTLSLTANVQAAITKAAKAANEDNEIKTGQYLSGGGFLGDSLIEIELSPAGELALERGLSSIQDEDLGALAKKDKITISDIQATGTASASQFLRGDGTWAQPTGGGGSSWNGGIITGDINSRHSNAYRLSSGSANTSAAILHKNETDFYILLTDSGARDGNFNNLRPFKINLASGRVFINHGLDVTGGDMKATGGKVFAGNAEFQGNGNIVGSIWNNWGENNAYTAISNRIEARARAYSARNLVINGDFRVDQRKGNGTVTQNLWGYDRWLNIPAGRQQYIEKVGVGIYALFWQGGGNGTLGTSAGGAPRVFTQNVAGQNLRVVVPFNASNVCVIKIPSVSDMPSLNPYSPRSFGEELQLCQRYYQKSSALSAMVSEPSTTSVTLPVTYGSTSAGAMKAWLTFPTRMARAPSMSFYAPSGAQGVRQLDEEGENLSITVPATPQVSETLCLITNAIAGNSDTRFYQFNYAADAEITA